MSDIRVMRFAPDEGTRVGGKELLVPADEIGGGWIWVHFEAPDLADERDRMRRLFAISDLAINDAQRDRHPPKFEELDNCVFLLLRQYAYEHVDHGEVRFNQLGLFAGTNFLVTRSPEPSKAVDKVWNQSTPDTLALGPAHTAYRICRQLIDLYTPMVFGLESRLADLEDRMFEQPSDQILEELADYNRILKKLRRTFNYQEVIMRQLANGDEGLLDSFDEHYFNDLYENTERLTSICQLNQELAVDLLNTYLSIASHRLNQIMRVLTIATVVFLPLGLIAGVYGMNFAYIPELGFRYGYFMVVGFMATIVVTLVLVFRRKKWL